MPVPSVLASIFSNKLNIFDWYCGSMPIPLSRTKKTVSLPWRSTPMSICGDDRSPMNLTAFSKRFCQISVRRERSPYKVTDSPPTWTFTPRSAIEPATILIASLISSAKVIFTGGLIIRPIRDISSNSCSNNPILSAALFIKSKSFSTRCLSAAVISWGKYPRNVLIVTSGLLRSWETVYVKRSSSMFFSASSLVYLSFSCSKSFRSVISCANTTTPIILPSSFLTGLWLTIKYDRFKDSSPE